MSTDMESEVHIEDEEGLVDKKTKQQVLGLREQVDDDERMLYVDRMSDPQSRLTIPEANKYWGISVRQYLRGIKRLWNDDAADSNDIRGVEQFWMEKTIGRETVVPPDKDGYQFSLMRQHDQYRESQLRQAIGLPRDASLPYPVTKTFNGLASVLNQNRLTHSWVVETDTTGPPPEHETVQLRVEMPVPKHILENAVEAADNFLQQAGLGFEAGVPDYYGGDEPGL